MEEFFYRIRRPAVGDFPGSHRSRRGEQGMEYRGHVPLGASSDVRRIDLRQSLRDPFGQWLVRVHNERKAVAVYLVADLSGSVGFRGATTKLDTLADFARSLGWSAYRNGDPFGFVGCDDAVRTDWLAPAARDKGAALRVAERLRTHRPAGTARGLLEAHRWLRRQRSLVFVASDFHLPLEQIDALLDSLTHHEVVPVVLWDSSEFLPQRNGLAWLVDAEDGRRRVLWLRPALRERFARARAEREQALRDCFRRHHVAPLWLEHGFDAAGATAHFHR